MQNRLFKILCSLVGAILLLSACFGEENRKILIESYTPNNYTADCIVLDLQLPDTIKVGEGFTSLLEVTNTCDKTITVEHGGGGDLLITQLDDKVIWQQDQGGVKTTPLFRNALSSGESFEEDGYIWSGNDSTNNPLKIGEYQAVATLSIINIINTDLEKSGMLESVKSFKITN